MNMMCGGIESCETIFQGPSCSLGELHVPRGRPTPSVFTKLYGKGQKTHLLHALQALGSIKINGKGQMTPLLHALQASGSIIQCVWQQSSLPRVLPLNMSDWLASA